MKKNLVIGMLANVDAGKTTLSEAILYECKAIRKTGRVDYGDAFLDTFDIEKERGITVFLKQALFETEKFNVSLIDTPGHTDFSSEMERTLSVIDAAIVIVSAADGITGMLRTIFRLLRYYGKPAVIFLNKMDQIGVEKDDLLEKLKKELGSGIVEFDSHEQEKNYEEIALLDECIFEKYIENGKIEEDDIKRLIRDCKLYPLCTGSALKQSGIKNLINIIDNYLPAPVYEKNFSARIFKISHDKGKKLCWLKVTGGTIKVKMAVNINGTEEKIDEIRIYSGSKYKSVSEAYSGNICVVTGLDEAKEGMIIGRTEENIPKMLESVMRYKVKIPENIDFMQAYRDFKMLEEEDPALKTEVNRETKEISLELMGNVQAEILTRIVKDRFNYDISFSTPEVVYKETITKKVEGVGHFEPLKHYAEVHLLIEPAERGSGITIESDCSTDKLSVNYQKLILSVLKRSKFKGVLTGSEVTDIKITLINGKAHEKHTEGGDFREATCRALRHGLMCTENEILEPVLGFSARLPEKNTGRFMNDIVEMGGMVNLPEKKESMNVLNGKVPLVSYGDYSMKISSYTGGLGNISIWLSGYEPCHNQKDVIEKKAYNAERDIENPASSVFCLHGVGTVIPWNKVKDYMHVDSKISEKEENDNSESIKRHIKDKPEKKTFKEIEKERRASEEELKRIFERTYGPIRKRVYNNENVKITEPKEDKKIRRKEKNINSKDYLLVDGYNIIFAWEELKNLASKDLGAARDRLLDIVSNYCGISGYDTIVVFDAYKVSGGQEKKYRYNNIDVIFTKEAETADLYIEKTAKNLAEKNKVMVATSDAIEQIIVFGAGAIRISAANFHEMIKNAEKEIEDKIKKLNN